MSIFHVTTLLILGGALMVLYRVIKGPTLLDRLLAASMVGTKTIVLLALVGFMYGRPDFLDIALVYALINFVAAVAIMAFLDRSNGAPQSAPDPSGLDTSTPSGSPPAPSPPATVEFGEIEATPGASTPLQMPVPPEPEPEPEPDPEPESQPETEVETELEPGRDPQASPGSPEDGPDPEDLIDAAFGTNEPEKAKKEEETP